VVHAKPALPAGHGEVLTRPAFSEWAGLAEANHQRASAWSFEVAGVPVDRVRSLARREALDAATEFSARLGAPVKSPGKPEGLIVMTGHQPELYHPGVWIKDFLLQRIADETGATAVDLVVDTDGFETVAVSSPCMTPGVARCHQYLALGAEDACFAGSPVPSADDLRDFCSAADSMLSSLPAPAVRRHFSAFCEQLSGAAGDAENLGELITMARRRYEAVAGSDYLELPLTKLGRTESWLTFVADLALSAERFAAAYNAELVEYRTVNKTRSAAQPFPDLALDGGSVELPLWRIVDGHRSGVRVVPEASGGARIVDAAGEPVVVLPADGAGAVEALRASGELFAPKALALTLFARVFVTDLMIHGVGGGRYDRVTDGVCRRYFGIEPPAYVVASMTMYLPLGAHIVTEDEVAAAKERLNRLDHNPDALLGEVEFDSAEEQSRAADLASEKSSLVAAIAVPGADKKVLGSRIRELNAELSALLAPLKGELAAELSALESQFAASEILTDRTYPFCFWSPEEVADKAR
jgi:hypothetical protein